MIHALCRHTLWQAADFELWDTAKYQAQEAALLLTEMPNSLKDLSF